MQQAALDLPGSSFHPHNLSRAAGEVNHERSSYRLMIMGKYTRNACRRGSGCGGVESSGPPG